MCYSSVTTRQKEVLAQLPSVQFSPQKHNGQDSDGTTASKWNLLTAEGPQTEGSCLFIDFWVGRGWGVERYRIQVEKNASVKAPKKEASE